MRTNARLTGQFKSPGQGPRGQQFGHKPFRGRQQGFPYPPGSYPGTPGTPGHPGMERRMSSTGSEGGDSFLQGPGDESFDYQQLASDDSRDTQHSVGGDTGPSHSGFHGAFGNGGGQQGFEPQEQQQQQPGDGGGGQAAGGGGGGGGSSTPQSPPDIKYEVTPMPFMKATDFELIEIDPDDEDL